MSARCRCPRPTHGGRRVLLTGGPAAGKTSVLEEKVLPLYFGDPAGWRQVMRLTIALNASFFNAQRMLQRYVVYAYALRGTPSDGVA